MTFQLKLQEYFKQIENNLLTLHNLSYLHDCEEIQNEQQKLDLEEQICGMIDKTENISKALSAASQEEVESIADVKQTYQNALLKAEGKQQKNYKLTKQYKEFQGKLSNIVRQVEATRNAATSEGRKTCVVTDEFVMESEINVFDPLTKKRIECPVRNTVCGHHYEKSSMYETLSLNPRQRCPVAGCGNKQLINKKCLVDDPEFKATLEQALLETELNE